MIHLNVRHVAQSQTIKIRSFLKRQNMKFLRHTLISFVAYQWWYTVWKSLLRPASPPRAQPGGGGGLRELKLPLSQVKVEKKDKKF